MTSGAQDFIKSLLGTGKRWTKASAFRADPRSPRNARVELGANYLASLQQWQRMIQRRDLLAGAAANGALSLLPLDLHGTSRAADDCWNAGLVAHLLPTVSHDRILLKASFP